MLDQRMFGAGISGCAIEFQRKLVLRWSKDAGSLSRPQSQEVACQWLPGEGLLREAGAHQGRATSSSFAEHRRSCGGDPRACYALLWEVLFEEEAECGNPMPSFKSFG
jgi:hypothetical protein